MGIVFSDLLSHVWLLQLYGLAHQALLGFPRQEYWSGLPFPSPGDLPDPGIKPTSPALAGGFFITESPGKPHKSCSTLVFTIEKNPHVSGPLQVQTYVVQWSAISVQFSCSDVSDFVTPWTAAHQASQSITNSWSLLKLMSIKLVMLSNHLIFCRPLLLLPSIFPSIRVFSNESVLHIRWPKYWNFSFSISLSNFLGWTGWISLQFKGLAKVCSNTTVQKHQFFSTQLSL